VARIKKKRARWRKKVPHELRSLFCVGRRTVERGEISTGFRPTLDVERKKKEATWHFVSYS